VVERFLAGFLRFGAAGAAVALRILTSAVTDFR
jgi:hypothetical protein